MSMLQSKRQQTRQASLYLTMFANGSRGMPWLQRHPLYRCSKQRPGAGGLPPVLRTGGPVAPPGCNSPLRKRPHRGQLLFSWPVFCLSIFRLGGAFRQGGSCIFFRLPPKAETARGPRQPERLEGAKAVFFSCPAGPTQAPGGGLVSRF